jgi:organic radical activating enzyme
MSKVIIEAYPMSNKSVPDEPYLKVSEFYMDTIQGEGIHSGCPASFLRLQGCSMNCVFCDTKEVWREGNPYTFGELLEMIEKTDLISRLKNGHHLVITGGSPLQQQKQLASFLQAFVRRFKYVPFIEVENECVIQPTPDFSQYVDTWNNSPKLCNSGVPWLKRHKKDIIFNVAQYENSWFKFVISGEEDWEEILNDFILPRIIRRNQVILMPEGTTAEEISAKREMVIDMAIKHNVRYSTREHIMVWGRRVGV